MSLENASITELRDIAKERGIDIKGLRKKDDIRQAIEAAEAKAESDDQPIVAEAEIIEKKAPAGELAVRFSPGVLSANFASLEAHIDEILADYEGWEPSPENLDDVKQCAVHRKYLNGLAKQIDERRKAVKNEYLQPLNAFESECNRIRDKVKDVSSRISDVEQEADEMRRQQKKEELEEHYQTYAGLLADVVPYDRIADSRWLNKKPTLAKAKEELEWKIDSVAKDWNALKDLNLEFAEQAEIRFFNTLNIGDAVAYANNLADDAHRIESMKSEMQQYAEPEQDSMPIAYEGSPVVCEASEYDPPHPVHADALEPFDPMTCEQEHRPLSPIPVQPEPMRPVSAPVVSQQIADTLAAYPESKQRNILEALRALQRPISGHHMPYVMIIDGATPEQLQVVGKFCGLVGVTGTFKQGTLQEVARRAAQGGAGQVMQYGA